MTVLDATRVLTECARELLCATGRDRRILSAAGPWPDATGIPPGALHGMLFEELVHDDDRVALRTYHEATVAGLAHGTIDVRVERGARTRVYDVALRVVEDVAVASFRDVTQQRAAEEQLGALNERLQQTNTELQRSNDELQRFAYVASHDLSEPLRMVTSYCALLVEDRGELLDDTSREYLAYAIDGALRMRALIDDLLAYSRVSWVSEPAVRVALRDVVDDALRDLGRIVEESGGEVTVGPLPTVLGNRAQLGQLVTNLVGNAVKFRSPDVAPRISVSARVEGARVTLVVSDNGIGIDPKHRERVFVMFKRLHGRGSYDGNGIGLALCKRIAELHGGNVWVEEAPGGGSAFHVTLVDADAAGTAAVPS